VFGGACLRARFPSVFYGIGDGGAQFGFDIGALRAGSECSTSAM